MIDRDGPMRWLLIAAFLLLAVTTAAQPAITSMLEQTLRMSMGRAIK